MAYIPGSTILAADYNALGWTDPSIGNQWGVGSGRHGLGQNTSSIAIVAIDSDITAAQWSSMIQITNKCLAHEGHSPVSPSGVVPGEDIFTYPSLSIGVGTAFANSGTTALSLSPGVVDTTTFGAAWGAASNFSLVCTQTVTFSSGDAARYFFNAGGTISLSFSRAGGSATIANTNWTNLAAACGTYILGYNNDFKVGGSGTPSNLQHLGYWGLTTSSTEHFRQYDTASGYTNNYVSVSVAWAGVPSNGGYPSVTFTITMMNTSAAIVDGTMSFNANLNYPSTTYLTNTWGVPANAGTITYASPGVLPPVNTSLPVISGTTTQGYTLSCSTGSWTWSPTSYTYQWYRNGVPISGATGNSYILVPADVTTSISCQVTAFNAAGSGSATSTGTAAIAGLAPTIASAPVVSGTTIQGYTLSCSTGSWNNIPTYYAYQWYRNGSIIGGETNSTYTLTSADAGYPISCDVLAGNAYGSNTYMSAQVGPITGLPPGIITAPNISGTAAYGYTLSTDNGTWSNSPTSYTYQWNRNGSPIGGATSSTYTLGYNDVGYDITCTVTAYNASGSASYGSNTISVVSGIPVGGTVTFQAYGSINDWAGYRVQVGAIQQYDLSYFTDSGSGLPATWINSPSFTYGGGWINGAPIGGGTFQIYTHNTLDGSAMGQPQTQNSGGAGTATYISSQNRIGISTGFAFGSYPLHYNDNDNDTAWSRDFNNLQVDYAWQKREGPDWGYCTITRTA